MTLRIPNWLALGLALSSILASQASAEIGQVIPMGDLERWAVFSLGQDGEIDRFSGDTLVQGDVGVAGAGDLTLAGNATINGSVYYRSNGTLKVGSGATITGGRFNNQNALLANGVDEATAASRAAAAFDATRPQKDIILGDNDTLGFTGGPGETVVLNLKSFKMSGNSTLTLDGTATTTYIINVKKTFSLSGHSRILFTGGLDWNNVLFNVRGKDSEVLLKDNAQFQGILMANRRTVRLRDDASIRGELIADRVLLDSASQVIHPPATSP